MNGAILEGIHTSRSIKTHRKTFGRISGKKIKEIFINKSLVNYLKAVMINISVRIIERFFEFMSEFLTLD